MDSQEACHSDLDGCFISGAWPVLVAWLGFVVVGLGTCCNAYKHLLNFTRPDLQPHVLRIILVGPIYAFSASLCLSMSENACFFVRSVRDIWEAVVIYSFLTLIIEYMGGEHLCLHSISQRDEAVPHLFPCNLCLPPISTGSMIRVPKMGALQFVAVKPVVAVVSIVVYACGQLHNWYYQWTLFFIYNISYSVALYALYLIYWSSHEQEALQSKRPLLKFVSVKMIVFLTFWQALLLPLAPLPGSTSRWEDFILSLEMIVFGVLMNVAFSWREFRLAPPRTPPAQRTGIDLLDLEHAKTPQGGGTQPSAATKSKEVPAPVSEDAGRASVVQNAKTAFYPRDIVMDASNNFSKRYKQHVLIESAQDYELERPKTPEGISVDLLDDSKGSSVARSAMSSLRHLRPPVFKLGRARGASPDSGSGRGSDEPAPTEGATSPEARSEVARANWPDWPAPGGNGEPKEAAAAPKLAGKAAEKLPDGL